MTAKGFLKLVFKVTISNTPFVCFFVGNCGAMASTGTGRDQSKVANGRFTVREGWEWDEVNADNLVKFVFNARKFKSV